MRRILFTLLLVQISISQSDGWGQTGHRVVGEIAERHLSRKASKAIKEILGNENLAEISNYMDFIKSDARYRHMNPWHYCTIPDDKTYAEAGVPEEGDVIQTINRLISELKSKQFTDEDEAFAIKCLVHLIGDIHQPLHVGNGEDRGGNDVRVEYFWQSSNLHRVWDSGIIDGQQYSYTEYVEWINHATESEIRDWQDDDIVTWADESKALRPQVYDLPDDKKINYRYNYDNIEALNRRLLQAGIRLAAVLNEIYG